MPAYSYKATDKHGNIRKGTTTAASSHEVATILKKRGYQPLTISGQKRSYNQKGQLPMVEKITFCRFVGTMLHSGLSLGEGMQVLKDETENKLLQTIIDDLLYALERGQSLSQVFEIYPNVFDTFFITLVRAGETSGTLANSFKYLEHELKAEYSLSQSIKSALVYPTIVILALVAIACLMIFFIMPQIGNVFLNMSIPLPTYTRFIFETSIFLSTYRWLIMGSMVFISIFLGFYVKTPSGKHVIFKLVSPIPVVKNLFKQIDIARFSRIMSTLLASAVPITEGLQIAIASLNYPEYKKRAAPIPNAVLQGKNLASAFTEHKVFPALLTQMIAAGEKSGTLDETLGEVADFYEGEVKEAVKKATQLLEPMLMLIVGIGVGAMILSIIAPLYSVVGNLQSGL